MSEIQYDIGDQPKFTGTFVDDAGDLTDPTQIQFLLLLPDDTELIFNFGVDAEILNPSIGIYTFEAHVLLVAGTYSYRWNGLGAIDTSGEAKIIVRASQFGTPLPVPP